MRFKLDVGGSVYDNEDKQVPNVWGEEGSIHDNDNHDDENDSIATLIIYPLCWGKNPACSPSQK